MLHPDARIEPDLVTVGQKTGSDSDGSSVEEYDRASSCGSNMSLQHPPTPLESLLLASGDLSEIADSTAFRASCEVHEHEADEVVGSKTADNKVEHPAVATSIGNSNANNNDNASGGSAGSVNDCRAQSLADMAGEEKGSDGDGNSSSSSSSSPSESENDNSGSSSSSIDESLLDRLGEGLVEGEGQVEGEGLVEGEGQVEGEGAGGGGEGMELGGEKTVEQEAATEIGIGGVQEVVMGE